MPKNVDESLLMKTQQWLVYGRRLPTESNPNPEIICIRVFGKNELFAKSQFWKINSTLHKFKRSSGEILKVQRVTERKTNAVRNFGIYLRFRHNTGQANAFKEYRAVSLQHAISQMYCEMGSRHKVTKESISILKTCTMSFEQCRMRNQRSRKWAESGTLTVPHWQTRVRPTDKQYQSRFNKQRPALYKTGTSIDA